jgi:hypothetical protein
MEIKKIRAMGKTKMVTIPKKSDLQVGEYVMLERVSNQINKSVEVTSQNTTSPESITAQNV